MTLTSEPTSETTSETLTEQRTPARGEARAATLVVGAVVGLLGLIALVRPAEFGVLAVLLGFGVVAVVVGLTSPLLTSLCMMAATFFRLVLPTGALPLDPFILAFLGLLLSVAVWNRRHGHTRAPVGLLELAIGLYLLWNVGSMLAPHPYEAGFPLEGTTLSVWRYVLIGTAMPLICLLVGRAAFARPDAMRAFLFATLGFAAYSALMSALSEWAPDLAWPRYMVTDTAWPDRAVGVFNQPVVNGFMLTLGFLAALLVASKQTERRAVRVSAGLLAPACLCGVYLTHTRSAFLGLLVVIVLGAVLARGWRTGFVATGALALLVVVVNWSTFTSSDRDAGGVSSSSEIFDRLNMIATGLWALGEKPVAGWGIGRFAALNTYHHQQWSPGIPWKSGYGLASHTDLVGIAAELGLVGLALWLLAFGVILVRLVRAVRILPHADGSDREFAVFALLALVCLLVTGLTVDLRAFDFPNIVVLLFVGAAIGRGELAAADARRHPDAAPDLVRHRPAVAPR